MQFTTNYHTHTARCGHARGSDREMVQAAVDAGIRILGMADHCPYPGVSGPAAGVRMTLEQTRGYFDSFAALRDAFAGQVELHIGFEAEYFPGLFEGMLDFLADYPCEYLILGQHFDSGDGGWYYGRPTDDEAVLARYVEQVIRGIESRRFAYVAHPDLCRFVGDAAVERKHYLALCQAAREYNLPLEVNLLGYRDRRGYPRESFFRLAQEVGNTLILGVDAHAPEQFADPAVMDDCCRWAAQFGLPVAATIPMGKGNLS